MTTQTHPLDTFTLKPESLFDSRSAALFILEVGKWGDYNFPGKVRPELGLVEEIGEFAHAILKSEQNIRNATADDAKDALADALVFLAHLSYKQHIHTMEIKQGCDEPLYLSVARYLAAISRILVILSSPRQFVTPILIDDAYSCLADIACSLGWDLRTFILPVWCEVRQRDWVKYPGTGKPQVNG